MAGEGKPEGKPGGLAGKAPAGERSAGRLALGFSGVGHFCSHLIPMLYFTVILGLEEEFGLSHGELKALATWSIMLYGLAALPAGWLGDRWSSIGMMVLFFIGIGTGSVVTGLASGVNGLLAGLILTGLFGSIYHPVGIAWLVANAEKRGQALGINGIFGAAGMAAAAGVAGWLMDGLSWRAAFVLPGLFCILTGLALAFAWLRGQVRDADRDLARNDPVRQKDGRKVLVILAIALLCGGFIHQALSSMMPKLFSLRLDGLTDGSAAATGSAVTVVYILAASANLVGGWLSDRLDLKLVYLGSWILLTPAVLIAASAHDLTLVSAMTLALFLQIGLLPAENSIIALYTRPEWRGLVFGAKFVLGFGVASLALPVTGYLFDARGSYQLALYGLAALSTLPVLAILFLPRQSGKSEPEPERKPGSSLQAAEEAAA